MTPTLTGFLLARIAEDAEQMAARVDGCCSPRRVLAECEAKRRIITEAQPTPHALKLLALPYADHPDYREEWRP